MSDAIDLTLHGMAHGGSAVGRYLGKAVFLPYSLPGERVRARITQDKGRFANAELIEVLEAAPERVTPRCKHFGVCGGCHWQHIDYPAQLRFKQQIVRDQFQRVGRLPDVRVHPTIPSPDPWAYRTHVTAHSTPEGRLGYISIDHHTVLPIEECHIIRPPLLELLLTSAGAGQRTRFQLSNDPGQRLISSASSEGDTELDAAGTGSAFVEYPIRDQQFRVSGGSFFQVNLAQAAVLVDLVLDRLTLTGSEHVLDLYAGVGLFTAFLAPRAAAVTMIESSPSAIRDALVNLEGFDRVTIVEGSVEEALSTLKERVDAAVIDPPRAGMAPRALSALLAQRPRRIAYVSCDPATLARDVRVLVDGGYRLVDVQPVDMFPQTYHIECVAALVLA